jgi:hypothetical protein
MNQIKVSAYTIQVRPKSRKRKEKKDGQKQKIEYVELGKIEDNSGTKYDFINIFKDFVKEFDSSFLGLKSGNKAMRLTDNLTFNSAKETISGFFKAGFTGEQKEIFEKNKKTDKSIFTVKSEHVNCSNFYFKLWLPKSSAMGLLLVQGTSAESAADLFKTLLHLFLTKSFKDNLVKISRFTSTETIEEFKKKSKVQKIVLSKNSYPKDVANDILGREILESNVRMKLIIEGDFKNDTILKFVNDNLGTSIGNQPKFFTSDTLEELHFGEEDEYDTDISFKDIINSKSAVAKSKSGFEIKPFTYIDENEIERDDITNVATEKSIIVAIDKYFAKIKKEVK